MDIRKVKKLIELLEASDVAEIEIHEGEESVRISRNSTAAPVMMTAAAPAQMAAPAPLAAATPAGDEAEPLPEGHIVRAPMVGTFYRASSPEAPNFVEEGDVVQKGQVICIIEAMKLMNEIEADASGRITTILLENASPVEYGEALFLIEPA